MLKHQRAPASKGRVDWRCPCRRYPEPSRARPRKSLPSRRYWRPGAMPRPPTRPGSRSDRMSPNRLVVTMTSNCQGFITSCIAQASTMRSSIAIRPSYSSGDLAAGLQKQPGQRFQHIRHTSASKSSPACCRNYSGPWWIGPPTRSIMPSCSQPSRTPRAAEAVARRRAILDRRCARRHIARAGRDGRMVPIEQKDWTEADRASKLGQNHPLNSAKRRKNKLFSPLRSSQ